MPAALARTLAALTLLAPLGGGAQAQEPAPLAEGVRGLVPMAPRRIIVDGKLDEWERAFCTPVHYGHPDVLNRAARFYYYWDREALYIGLVALDRRPGNIGEMPSLWNGDAVEFYLDTRQGDAFRSAEWSTGAVHLFFTPFEQRMVRPRWTVRQGIATSDVKLQGVDLAATADDESYTLEFKLPWANFPGFEPKPGAKIAIDAELCSGDGGPRTDRTFAFGSPLSVQQPASLGTLQLVEEYDPATLMQVGPATFPMWVDTPWKQPERAMVEAVVAVPPEFAEIVGAIEVRLHGLDGSILKTVPAPIQPIGPEGKGFARALATWSIDEFAPGSYFATAEIRARTEKPMARVAPRMVLEAQMSGR